MESNIDIEYQTHANFVIEKWEPATLRIKPGSVAIADNNGATILADDFSRIAQARLTRIVGGEPARFELLTQEGSHLITIRPKQRRLRPLKQVSELKSIASALNNNSGMTIADTGKVMRLQWVTISGVATLMVIVAFAFINMF